MQLLALFASLALLPLIRALTITAPNAGTPWTGNQTVQITWTSVAGDPATFSIELTRPNQNLGPYNGALAVGTNIPTANGQYTFELPQVPPGAGYQLTFVNISNINTVYATSDTFSVTENDTASTTSMSSTGTMSMLSSMTSTSASAMSSSSASSTSSSMSGTPTSFSAASSLVSPTWLRELVTASTVLSVGIALGFGLLA